MTTLDTLHTFETPEGVELGLRAAGPVPRALAFVIDLLIRSVAFAVLAVVLSQLAELGVGAMLLLLFFIEWFYPVLFEVRNGQTPGKRALKLKVVHHNGTPVAWSASLIRNLLRVVDFFPVFYGLGLMSCLIHPRFKRLGDLAAGTLVVYTENGHRSGAIPEVAPKPLPVALDIDEERALLEFAERTASLTPARAQELAGILTGHEDEASVQRLLAYANGLLR